MNIVTLRFIGITRMSESGWIDKADCRRGMNVRMKCKFATLLALVFVLIAQNTPANAWISKNTTNSGGESLFYVQTYNLRGVGATDNLGTSSGPAKIFTVGCSEGLFEIVLYEQNFPDGNLLVMGKNSSASIAIDSAKPVNIRVKEKSVGDVILIVDSKGFYKKIAKSKSVTITYKVGGTNWVGKFKTAGLAGHASNFSRYGCTV